MSGKIPTTLGAGLGLDQLQTVVQLTSAPKQIADHILSAIAVGALTPGSALPSERNLASALNVSRSSVRLALDRLERLRVVDRRRGRGGGTFVLDPHDDPDAWAGTSSTLREFFASRQDLLDARSLVQKQIAETAASRRTEADIDAIGRALAAHEGTIEANQSRAADGRFHALIAMAARNPVLAEIAVDLDKRINIGFRHDPFSLALHDVAVEHHRAIAQAIAGADDSEAGRLMEIHFRATGDPAVPT